VAEAGQPDVDDLLREIRRLKVSDVLVSTFQTVAQLGYAKLDPESRDLEQARIAVEGLKALAGVLEGHVPPETTRDFNQLVANLQLAYASAATAPVGERDSGSEPQSPESPPEPASEAGSEAAENVSGSEPQSPEGSSEPASEAGSEASEEASGSEPQSDDAAG
jgi:hypothetical protein